MYSPHLVPALAQLAQSVAASRARRDSRALAFIGSPSPAFTRAYDSPCGELQIEAQSAAGEAVAVFLSRFASFAPRAGDCLASRLARLAAGDYSPAPDRFGPDRFGPRQFPRPLSSAFPRSVWKAAHKAADKTLRKMAHIDDAGTLLAQASRLRNRANSPRKGERKTHAQLLSEANAKTEAAQSMADGRTFDASGWGDALLATLPATVPATDQNRRDAEELACVTIRARADGLRAQVRARADEKGTGYARRDAVKFLAMVNDCEEAALHAARGEPFAALPAFGFKQIQRVNVVETLVKTDLAGRPKAGGGERKRKAGGEREPVARLYARWVRLCAFIGEPLPVPRPRYVSEGERAENRFLSARAAWMDYACELSARHASPVPAPRPSLRPVKYIRDYTMGGRGKSFA